MEDWKPANEVRGLFSPEAAEKTPAQVETPKSAAAAPAPSIVAAGGSSPGFESAPSFPSSSRSTRKKGTGDGLSFEPLKYGRLFGQPMLLLGLILVLSARGCDAVGNRGVGRLEAKAARANEKSTDPDEGASAKEEYSDEAQEYSRSARYARYSNQIWGYWRELLFSFGTIVLAIGLLATGFTSEGAGRWICLIMLTILMFAYYIGGVASIHTFVPPGVLNR